MDCYLKPKCQEFETCVNFHDASARENSEHHYPALQP